MPDLGSLFNSPPLSLPPSQNLKPVTDQRDSSVSLTPKSVETLAPERPESNGNEVRVFRKARGGKMIEGTKCLDDYVKAWVANKVESGMDERKYFLPFLVGAPRLAECRVCKTSIHPGKEVLCSVHGCQAVFHSSCAREKCWSSSLKIIKCPQHACYLCKQKSFWRCVRCVVASHDKCAAFPEGVIHLNNQPGRAVCWRHPADWRLEKHAVPTSSIEEIFCHLPLPYIEEEFKIDFTWRDTMENRLEPPPYVHIRRNVYLIKKKRNDVDGDIGCTNCNSTTCSEDCVCRVSLSQTDFREAIGDCLSLSPQSSPSWVSNTQRYSKIGDRRSGFDLNSALELACDCEGLKLPNLE